MEVTETGADGKMRTELTRRDIKAIEDLSLNAWPSHQMQLYDGWILRFSHFYTHRTNCVEQIGPSQIAISDKITYCEEIYRRWKTPCIFKITPLMDPSFDRMLEERGYEIQHKTAVMQCSLSADHAEAAPGLSTVHGETAIEMVKVPAVGHPEVHIERRISDEWIDALFAIKGNATVVHLKIVPSMYAAIPKDVLCASIRVDDRIVATGLGILDRDYIGIYAINVDKEYRRRHFARKICETLLQRGREAGASKAYLQVVDGNEPALALYQSLGLSIAYYYWFRVK